MANFAGLYFGVDFVDLVVLSRVKGTLKIIRSVRTFLFDEAPPLDKKDKTRALPLAVKKALDSIRLNIGMLNFGLPQDEVMVRHFKMPYIPIDERANAVRFEAQKYLPFRLDDTLSDFYITEESKTAKDMGVLFAAINRQTRDKYTALFEDRGVKLNVLDITPVALLRVLSAARKLAQGHTQVVVCVEKDVRASIIIVRDKNVYLAREIGPCASKSALLESVLNNIRLSIDYYKRETKEESLREIIICGEGELPELETYLKENIGAIPVTVFNLNNELPGLNDLSKKQLVAIGLAMASLEKPGPKINLLGQAAKGVISKDIERYRPLVVEAAIVFLILTLLGISGNINLDLVKKKIARVKEEKAASAKGVGIDTSIEELLMMEAKTRAQIEFLKGLAGEGRFFLTKKMNALGATLPPGAWVESFQFINEVDKERMLTIKGMIYSEEANEAGIANRMLSDMKGTKGFYLGFEDIRLSSLEKASAYDKEVLAFIVKCVGRPLESSGLFGEGVQD